MHVMISVRNAQGGAKMIRKTLKSRREQLNYSQQEVADQAGIERSYYAKIESGLTPSVKVAKAVGEVLGVEWTVFFEEVGADIAQEVGCS